MMILEAENVCFRRKNFNILNVNFKVAKSELVSIIGRNGAGKSSLLNIMAGLISSQEGDLILSGRNVSEIDFMEFASLRSYVPQHTNMTVEMSVRDFIEYGQFRFGKAKKPEIPFRELIKDFHLSEIENKKVAQLSGGEKQRVLIASAIYQDSNLLLMDEPTSNLDYNFIDLFLFCLKKYVLERDRSAVMVTHDLNLSLQNSHKILALNGGSPVFWGQPKEVSPEILKVVYEREFDYLKDSSSPIGWVKC